MSKQLRLPFAVSKAKLQTFFINELGRPLSRATFRKHTRLIEFCERELQLTPEVFKRRKNFFGHEVEAICKEYGIDMDELVD